MERPDSESCWLKRIRVCLVLIKHYYENLEILAEKFTVDVKKAVSK